MIKTKEKAVKKITLESLIGECKGFLTNKEREAYIDGCIAGMRSSRAMFEAITKDIFKDNILECPEGLDIDDLKFFENVLKKVKG